MASGFKINPRGIEQIKREVEREFAKDPVQLPLHAGVRLSPGGGGVVVGSELELVAGWLLDWGYLHSTSKPGLVPSVAEMMAEVGVEDFIRSVEPYVDVALDALAEAGMLNDAVRTFGTSGMSRSIWLSDAGRREAVSRIERRKDYRARRITCRDAVLRWVYERDASGGSTDIGGIPKSPYGWFNGVRFRPDELAEAVRFLRERQLLGGTGDVLTIQQRGTECVEQYSGVVEYLNRGDGGGVNVTILGNNSGQLAVANRDVAQTQTNTNQVEALAIFAKALREFGQLLPAEQQPEYKEVATALEREAAKAEPNKGWVKALLDRAKGLLEGAPANLHNLAQVTKVVFDIYGQSAG